MVWGTAALCLWLAYAGGAAAASAEAAGTKPEQADGFRLELQEGAKTRIEPPLVVVDGPFTLSYGSTTVSGLHLEYDDRARVAVITGDVRAQQPGQVLTGKSMTVDLGRDRIEVDGALATISLEGAEDPVHLGAAAMLAERDRVEARGAELTTCPLPFDRAHYRVTVRSVVVRPGRDVAAHHAVFWESGVPIFYWPYLHFSLVNPRAGRFTPPEVGWGEREGWFIQTQFPYMGPWDGYGYLGLHYYGRLGPGLSWYHSLYDDGSTFAGLTAEVTPDWTRQGPSDWRLGTEAFVAGGGGSVDLDAGVAAERGLLGREERAWWSASGSMPELGLRVGLLARGWRPAGGTAPMAGIVTGRLSLRPPASGPVRVEAEGRWDLATLPDKAPRDLWDLAGSASWQAGPVLLKLLVGRVTHPDLYVDSQDKTEWQAVTTLPEVEAAVTALRLDGSIPARLVWHAAVGRYGERRVADEGVSDTWATRLSTWPELSLGPVALGPLVLDASTSMRWDGYSTGASRVSASAGSSVRWELAPGTSLSATYRLRSPLEDLTAWPQGTSPFAWDAMTYQQTVQVAAVTGQGRPLTGRLQSTYDVAQGLWKEVQASAQAKLGDAGASATATYDVQEGLWRSVLGELRWSGEAGRVQVAARYAPALAQFDQVGAQVAWRLPGRLSVELGALYLPPEHSVQRADVQLAWRIQPEWVVSVGGSWDSRLGGVLSSELGVALDQDCRTIGLRYDPAAKRWALGYQIKAFPSVGAAIGALRPDSLTEESQWQRLLQEMGQAPGE